MRKFSIGVSNGGVGQARRKLKSGTHFCSSVVGATQAAWTCRRRRNARDWKIATTSRLGWICTTLKKEERRDSFFWLNFGCDLAPIAEALSFHHDHVVFFEDRH